MFFFVIIISFYCLEVFEYNYLFSVFFKVFLYLYSVYFITFIQFYFYFNIILCINI